VLRAPPPQVFVYLAGVQLLLMSGRRSLLVLGTSLVAGALYRLNFCGLRKLRVRRARAQRTQGRSGR
jgi:hypothetical protein